MKNLTACSNPLRRHSNLFVAFVPASRHVFSEGGTGEVKALEKCQECLKLDLCALTYL